ncbi:hypothetical protein EV363DRAFT_1341695 [Boletus edulis]|nr:hypothetical protein EV363DRAFT_1341695 [Boletus edulis]
MIKNNVASVEGVAHLSLSPAGRVAERCTPSLRDAGVPRARSLPQRSSNPTDSVSPPSVYSPHPSSTSLTGQTTVASTVPAKPARSPEFSDEESPRESSNFSFHFDQYEEWTDEVEARMQNEIDRMLEDARRVLAEPVINISELFPDDLLADSVAHQTAANIRARFAAADDMIKELEAMAEDDDLWEELGMYVPLSPIPEESLADEFVVEEDAHSPPQSFKHAICFEERQWVADNVRITTKSSGEPPIPPTPPDVYLRRRRRRWKPPDSYPMAKKKIRKLTKSIRGDHGSKNDTYLATFDLGKFIMIDVPRASEHPFVACGLAADYTREFGMQSHGAVIIGRLGSNIALANTQSTSPWWNGIVAREAVM